MHGPEPLHAEALGWVDPIHAFRASEGIPGRVFLDSSGPVGPLSRWSVLAVRPVEVIEARVGDGLAGDGLAHDPFERLGALHARWAAHARRSVSAGSGLAGMVRGLNPPAETLDCGKAPFTGGVIGLVGYDCGRMVERLPSFALDDPRLPDLWAGVYDGALVFDRLRQRLVAFSRRLDGQDRVKELISIRNAGARIEQRTESQEDGAAMRIAALRAAGSPNLCAGCGDAGATAVGVGDRAWFLDGVSRIREEIGRGEIYQANLTRRFVRDIGGDDPSRIYERLRALSPTPFAAFVDAGGFQVLSVSPERLVRIDGGVVETRPIKGTRRRGADEGEDRVLRAELLSSEKDAAELLMIVDLERNDLGRIARTGTVEVLDFPSIETYSTVTHLVATVRARVRSGTAPEMVLRSVFPGGSITGAPKIRAMEILDALEPHRRKFAMGALVAWDLGGCLDASILIRTMVVHRSQAIFNVGAGIVADSSPDEEFRETEAKVAPLVAALEVA